jgi:predicted nucleic acid-binding protein
MVVVSDTSAITNLIQLGLLDILHTLFGEILLAEAVKKELDQLPNQSAVLDTKEWIKIAAIQDTHLLQELLLSLDEGEAASIILAIEKQADYLIIDESEGRKAAQKFNIRITGLLGVLVRAKQKGLIPALMPIMDELVINMKFRIHTELYEEVLKQAGER